MPMTDLGGFGQCKRQEMCHEGRALLDLLDRSKNFDLGIRNQLFFTKKQGAGELFLYKFAIGVYSH